MVGLKHPYEELDFTWSGMGSYRRVLSIGVMRSDLGCKGSLWLLHCLQTNGGFGGSWKSR